MEISFNDGDNFIRNAVTIKCGSYSSLTSPPARKMTAERPSGEGLPVPVDDLLLDLRIDSDEESATLERMELGACAFLERRTGYVLLPGRYQVDMPGWWSGPLEIMRGPLRQLVSVSYLDAAGTSVDVADLASFWVDENDRSFLVQPLKSFERPELWTEVGRVRLTFDAGFPLPDESVSDLQEMDDGLRTCLIMLVGHYYQNRELFAAGKLEAIETGARDLLGTYRQFW